MKRGIRHKIEYYLYTYIKHTREVPVSVLEPEQIEWAHMISRWISAHGIRINEKTLKAELDPKASAPSIYGLAISEKYINKCMTHDSILPLFQEDSFFNSTLNKALTDLAITAASKGLIYP